MDAFSPVIIHEENTDERNIRGRMKTHYLYAEISSVDVVAQEEILGIGRRSAHFKQFHQIVKLSVNVATN